MSSTVVTVVISLLTGAVFFTALAAFTLRDFSRGRLDEICKRHGNEDRFGIILRKYESAIVAVELLLTTAMTALVAVVIQGLNLWQVPADASNVWFLRIVRTLVAFVPFVAMGIVLPWSLARAIGEPFLYWAWPLISALRVVMKPFVAVVQQFDTLVHRLVGVEQFSNTDAATLTEEIRTVVDEGHREGIIESEASTMIRRVMQLQGEDAAAIMTPRTDMVCIGVDSNLEEARKLLLTAGHSRIPVIGETTDDIVGILYAKDLLQYLGASTHRATLREIVREPLYVPETTGIDTLLETMKRERVHIAIVVDEYGGVSGLVSLEDILEEIVGDIVDEYDSAEEAGIRSVEPGVTEVDARVHIDELNEQFDFGLPEDGDFDTIGGFVYTQLHRVPEANDSFTWNTLRFTVLDADKRKIRKLRIEVDKSLAAASTEEN